MLYVQFQSNFHNYQGHIGDQKLTRLSEEQSVVEVQADGHELERCCEILGRELPPNRVYTFLGVNAQEIARNWM
jgi:hypothetical protein